MCLCVNSTHSVQKCCVSEARPSFQRWRGWHARLKNSIKTDRHAGSSSKTVMEQHPPEVKCSLPGHFTPEDVAPWSSYSRGCDPRGDLLWRGLSPHGVDCPHRLRLSNLVKHCGNSFIWQRENPLYRIRGGRDHSLRWRALPSRVNIPGRAFYSRVELLRNREHCK